MERLNEFGVAINEYGISVRNLAGGFLSVCETLEVDDNIKLDIKDDETPESQELDKFLSGFKVIEEQEVC
ncbi:MAG: hypothetical protein K2F81_07300 [Ruminococcus sp.]|nr:hypothetical protein [Ruminococcus sp.]